jgi:ribosome biogenesis protein YTM1
MAPYGDNNDQADDDNDKGEQVRVSLTLAVSCTDRSLEVPNEPIAVPADIGRKGLSAVINHLLDRVAAGDDEDDDNSNEDMKDDDENRLPALPFDFIVGTNRNLLRTGVEREARRSGMSLEQDIKITYFPAQEAPDLTGESEPLPDWISGMSFVSTKKNNLLCTATYDGSIHVYRPSVDKDSEDQSMALENVASKSAVHNGPIKCLAAATDTDDTMWIASGSMDHSLALHTLDPKTNDLSAYATCAGGHTSALGSVDIWGRDKLLASGDWDGGISIWDFSETPEDSVDDEQATKKVKTGSKSKKTKKTETKTLAPKYSIQAHSSKISGVSFGNFEKQNDSSSAQRQLITGSWDHSLKVWDIERQDCLLTLNGSRVISCLDTSYHSAGVVATGHPDCMVRLWDVRTDQSRETNLALSDNTFKPSHKAWISSVQWSRRDPYQLASTSHDGTIKLWDIRSSLPLHTVRAFPKKEKGLCLAFGTAESDAAGLLLVGGTDCVVKHFSTKN